MTLFLALTPLIAMLVAGLGADRSFADDDTGALATLYVIPTSAPVGSSVTVKGKNYSASSSVTNIEMRFDSRTGPIVWQINPTEVFERTFIIPADISIGLHTVIATQTDSNGTVLSGMPGRASLETTAASSPPIPPSSTTTTVAPSQPAEVCPPGSLRAGATIPFLSEYLFSKHIILIHGYDTAQPGDSRFGPDVDSLEDVKRLVADAFCYGTESPSPDDPRYKYEVDGGDRVHYYENGQLTSKIRLHVTSGEVTTIFPY